MNAPALVNAAMRWALWNSAGAGVVVVLVLLAQYLLGSRISARWRYNLWLLVVVRLVLPTLPGVHVQLPHWARLGVAERETGAAMRSAPGLAGTPARIEPERMLVPLSRQTPLRLTVSASDDGAPVVERMSGAPRGDAGNGMIAEKVEIDSQLTGLPQEEVVANAVGGGVSSSALGAPRVLAKQAGAPPRAVPWLWTAELIWMAGAAAGLLRLMWTSARLWHATRELRPITDPAVHELLVDCCHLMRVRRVPILLAALVNSSPALVGIRRPKLLLPPCVLKDFERRELRQIVLHELAHLKRHDIAANYLLTVLQAIHWFNPLFWLAFARMRADREVACDEAVLRLTPLRECRAYGCTMLKLLEVLCRPGVPAGALGVVQHKALMHRRIAMIAKFDPQQRNRSATGALLSLMLIGAAVASAVRAQDAPVATPAPAYADQQGVSGDRAAVPAAAEKADRQNLPPVSRNLSGAANPLDPNAGQPTPMPSPGTTPGGGPMPGPAVTPGMPGSVQLFATAQAPVDSIRSVEDPAAVQANAKTAEKLKKSQSSQFSGVPLRDVLSFFADAGGIDIVLDDKSLSNDLGVDAGSSAVTMVMREPRPLEQVLQLALRLVNPQIDYSLVNGVVLVSSRGELARHIVTRAYDIGGSDQAELSNLIMNTIGPSASVSFVAQRLLVTASEPRQRDVGKLLALVASPPGRHQVGQSGNPSSPFLYRLRNANARELASVLSPAFAAHSNIAFDERTNTLLVVGPAEDRKVIETLLARLDQPEHGAAKTPPEALPEQSKNALSQMRQLAEEAVTVSKKFGSKSTQTAMIGRQLDVLGREMETLASHLTKEGRDAEVEKLRSEMDQIKAILAPLSSEPELLPPPAAR